MKKMKKNSGVVLNIIFIIIMIIFLYNSTSKSNFKSGFSNKGSLNTNTTINDMVVKLMDPQNCGEIYYHKGYKSQCDFLNDHKECSSDGFFNYIEFFYCDCMKFRFLGYIVLGVWLIVLFYLLGNTASDYFCCSLEKLSDLLNMSPTVAGVTLLPLGNGAPDVFASIAAFMGKDSGNVGLNGVLGGAVFVTSIVVGVVSICIANKRVHIDKKCFVRDICVFLFTILCLGIILVIGKVNVWGAVAFVSIYVVYACLVAANEIMKMRGMNSGLNGFTPLLPVAASFFPRNGDNNESLDSPLICSADQDQPSGLLPKLPHWIWNNNVAIYSDYVKTREEDGPSPLWGWTDENGGNEQSSSLFCKTCSLLEVPLSIPRRLTIPIVEEDRWSKFFAVASAFLSPLVLAFLWNTQENIGSLSGKIAYFIGFGVGSILGFLAFFCTSSEHPPRKFLLLWVLGGFCMSIVWFYFVANELVSLLVTIGIILGISPSMLALTVLAWGNSVGDLVSNTALAMNDRNGAQIAMSGCYAGPMFNTLVGLGVSLLLGAWSMGSKPYTIPKDNSLFITMGFLVASLIWSLVVLPRYDMQPNKILGFGLISIYVIFLSLRIGTSLASSSLDGVGIKPLSI